MPKAIYRSLFEVGYLLGLRIYGCPSEEVREANMHMLRQRIVKIRRLTTFVLAEQRAAQRLRYRIEDMLEYYDKSTSVTALLLSDDVRKIASRVAASGDHWIELGGLAARHEHGFDSAGTLESLWEKLQATAGKDYLWIKGTVDKMPTEQTQRVGVLANRIRMLFQAVWVFSEDRCSVAGVKVARSEYAILVTLRCCAPRSFRIQDVVKATGIESSRNILASIRKNAKFKRLVSSSGRYKWVDDSFARPSKNNTPPEVAAYLKEMNI